jgi:hypothetical protein
LSGEASRADASMKSPADSYCSTRATTCSKSVSSPEAAFRMKRGRSSAGRSTASWNNSSICRQRSGFIGKS